MRSNVDIYKTKYDGVNATTFRELLIHEDSCVYGIQDYDIEDHTPIVTIIDPETAWGWRGVGFGIILNRKKRDLIAIIDKGVAWK